MESTKVSYLFLYKMRLDEIIQLIEATKEELIRALDTNLTELRQIMINQIDTKINDAIRMIYARIDLENDSPEYI